MKNYQLKVIDVEKPGNIINTSERAESAEEAKVKVLERLLRSSSKQYEVIDCRPNV